MSGQHRSRKLPLVGQTQRWMGGHEEKEVLQASWLMMLDWGQNAPFTGDRAKGSMLLTTGVRQNIRFFDVPDTQITINLSMGA